MSLLTALSAVQAAAANVEDLNCGGCGLFAAAVGKQIEKLGVKVKVRIGHWPFVVKTDAIPRGRKNNSKTLDEWNDSGLNIGHAFLEFEHEGEKYHFDSGGVTKANESNCPTLKSMVPYPDSLNLRELALTVRQQDGWNTSFNRKEFPALSKEIKTIFKKYRAAA